MAEENGITFEKVDDLFLDMENPRLPNGLEKKDKSVLSFIAKTTSLEDLMDAIAKNGFFPGEPLVVVKENNRLIVVEGNRRLSAVKLLNNPDAIENPGRALREISGSLKEKIKALPVVIKETRAEVLPYLGFRHITGVKQWDPLSKARYMNQLFSRTDGSLNATERYKEVARSIGSKSNHIKRNLDALAVYEIIEGEGFYDIANLDEETIKFAVLSTALADERIACFIGTSARDENDNVVTNNPILNKKELNLAHIKDLTSWLYEKDESGRTRVGESRNLKQLGAIVDTPAALSAFNSGSSLEYAFRLSKGSDEEFLELLYSAEISISKAAGLVANVDFSEQGYELARDLLQNIKLIGTTLKNKRSEDDEF